MLQPGEADLALGYISDLDAGHFQQVRLPQDWACLANAKHARIRDPITARDFRWEAHVLIRSGTGHQLLADALKEQHMVLDAALELPGFLGLPAIAGTTDLIATLPRHIGETLARYYGLRVLDCPLAIAGFTVKQYWQARFHHDPASPWLRDLCGERFNRRSCGVYIVPVGQGIEGHAICIRNGALADPVQRRKLPTIPSFRHSLSSEA